MFLSTALMMGDKVQCSIAPPEKGVKLSGCTSFFAWGRQRAEKEVEWGGLGKRTQADGRQERW
jgi:hypothetical protein